MNRLGSLLLASLVALATIGGTANLHAHGTSTNYVMGADKVPASLAVRAKLAEPPKGTQELKFQDMFQMPVGPKGIEASERLSKLDGQRVRMVGFMVRSSEPRLSGFILAPMPVEISDEDEAEADDIPFNAVLVRLPASFAETIPNLAGLLQISGVLRVASTQDGDSSRIFALSIDLDRIPTKALFKAARQLARAEEISRKRPR